MPRKKKKPAAQKPAPMRWEFDPDIPTHDFLEEGPLDDPWNLQQAVENFVSWVEEGQFLTWEAVVCEEQGLPLTAGQKKAVRSLLSFNDEEDDQILYIDEIPRPSDPSAHRGLVGWLADVKGRSLWQANPPQFMSSPSNCGVRAFAAA